MSKPQNLAATITVLVVVCLFVWTQFGDELAALNARGSIPELDGPFFPDPDPRADALIGAVRSALEDLAPTPQAEPSPTPSSAEEAASADGSASDDDDSAVEDTVWRARTEPELRRDFPALAEIDDEQQWIVSLYPVSPGAPLPHPIFGPLNEGVLPLAAELWQQLPLSLRTRKMVDQARIKVDLVVGEERSFAYDSGPRSLRGVELDEGLDGVVLRNERYPDFWFPPSQPIERKINRRGIHGRARRYAREVAGWKKSHTKSDQTTFAAFRTSSWVEGAPGGGSIVALTRGNTDVPEISPEVLRERIALAGDFLTRETAEDGEITYEYLAHEDDSSSEDYNILRHAGTVYSMMQAYRVTKDRATYEASMRAMRFYRRAMKEDTKHPGEFFVLSVSRIAVSRSGSRGPRIGRRAKLGGIGLGLCMMVELEKSVPGSVDMDEVYGMARHAVRMQNPDGSFESFYNHDGREKSKRKSIYYSGEAILGLVRLHQLTGDEQWLDVAERGADYLVDERWKSLGIRIYVPPDAWLLQALEELDRVRPDDGRANYAFDLGEMIARHKLMDPEVAPPDLLGADLASLGSLPNSATAGSFGEALSAAARLEARRRPGKTRFRTFAFHNAEFQLRHQFWGPNEYFLPNPERAHGGFRVKPDHAEVRNDYVQHNLSGLFGLLDLIDESAPDIGWLVPEDQRPQLPSAGGR